MIKLFCDCCATENCTSATSLTVSLSYFFIYYFFPCTPVRYYRVVAVGRNRSNDRCTSNRILNAVFITRRALPMMTCTPQRPAGNAQVNTTTTIIARVGPRAFCLTQGLRTIPQRRIKTLYAIRNVTWYVLYRGGGRRWETRNGRRVSF
jgi:hypothetical protein